MILFGLGLITGLVVSVGFWWMLSHRLVQRLTARNGLAWQTSLFETQRHTRDSGRTTKPRPNAGPPARVIDGLGTRPGSLARNRINSAGNRS